jgi:uncharacterized SAM-binding protein YcdF (DUF218 family)
MIDVFLRQILPLLEPLGLAWLALIVLGSVLTWRRQRGPAIGVWAVVAIITVMGGTNLPARMLRRMERPWAGLQIAALPACDAVVVLGGGADASRFEAGGIHLTKAGDRVVMALELMRLGKAPALAIGGGSSNLDGVEKIEADLVKSWLQTWKLPATGEIVSLGAAADTRDEALRFAAIAKERGWHRVLLVTSACHMRRAIAVYRTLGLEPVAVPCNFLSSVGVAGDGPAICIPNWSGFERFSVWVHETAGWVIYRRRGWIDDSSAR